MKILAKGCAIALFLLVSIFEYTEAQVVKKIGYEETGKASYYPGHRNRRVTASGEVYDMYSLTASHKYIAFDCMVKVRNLDNGKEIVVRVNDRAYTDSRIIDLSYQGAEELGMLGKNTVNVAIEVIALSPPQQVVETDTLSVLGDTVTVAFDEDFLDKFNPVGTYNENGQQVKLTGVCVQVDESQEITETLAVFKAYQKLLFRDIFIQTGWSQGKRVFRVVLGTFEQEEEAYPLVKLLQNNGVKTIIKRHY